MYLCLLNADERAPPSSTLYVLLYFGIKDPPLFLLFFCFSSRFFFTVYHNILIYISSFFRAVGPSFPSRFTFHWGGGWGALPPTYVLPLVCALIQSQSFTFYFVPLVFSCPVDMFRHLGAGMRKFCHGCLGGGAVGYVMVWYNRGVRLSIIGARIVPSIDRWVNVRFPYIGGQQGKFSPMAKD